LEVECNNDQDLFASYHPDEAGMTAAELPPVTNVTAGFNPDGRVLPVSTREKI
jgi:hypothetical protein